MAFSGLGTGTEADPYQITTVAQLQEMKDYLTSSFILMNDIDASATETWNLSGSTYLGFEPVGFASPFLGTFDGGGYKITGLYVNRTTLNAHAALFSSIRSASSEEKVTNGSFTGDTGWTKGTGWTLPGTYALISVTAGQGTLSQNCSVVAGETYILVYTISSYSAGTLTPSCGGVTLTAQSGNVTGFAQQFTAVSNANLVFTPSSTPVDTSSMRVDNVSLIRVLTFKDVNLVNADITGYYAGLFSVSIYGKDTTNLYTVLDNIKVSGRVVGTINPGGFFSSSSSGISVTDCESNCYVETSSGFVGGFAGEIRGGTFTNCKSLGVVSAPGTLSDAGGFVGHITTNNTTFSGCRSNASILADTSSTGSYIGGFVGLDETSSTYTLCGSTGDVTYTHTASAQIGGFIGIGNSSTFSKCYAKGDIYASNCTGTLWAGGFAAGVLSCADCYSWGDVCSTGLATGTSSIVGGFIAITNGDTLTDCYSTGFVTSDAGKHGGFVGDNNGTTTFTTCYWDTENSEQSAAAGEGTSSGVSGLTTAQAILQASYTGFDFVSTWEDGTVTAFEQEGTNITLWASHTNDYDNFQMGDKDDDAIENEIPTQNEIRFVAALEALIIGTAGDEWKLGSNKLATPITPTNITIKQQSEYGSSLIQPVKINSAILFVDIVARKLREAAYDSNSEKFLSPDLTALAEHITKTGITTIARQKNPDSILWCTLTDGTLLSFTYERDQNVLAWAKHPLGGDGFCQSVCVLPGATEDVVYISVYRTRVGSAVTRDGETITRDGETVYWGESENVFIEKIMPRTFDAISDCFFVDCGITATRATETSIVTGLSHLEGQTVKLLVDGVEADEDVVEDGQVTVSFAGVASVTWTTAHVGLAYTSLLQPLRIVIGDSHGAITKVPELNASFLDTGAASYGNDDSDVKAIDFTQIGLINTSDITGLYTGQTKLTLPGGFSTENPIYISSDKPLPCTVRALMCRIEKTGR